MEDFEVTPDKKLKINLLGFQSWLQRRYPALIGLTVSDNGSDGYRIHWERSESADQEAALRHEIAESAKDEQVREYRKHQRQEERLQAHLESNLAQCRARQQELARRITELSNLDIFDDNQTDEGD